MAQAVRWQGASCRVAPHRRQSTASARSRLVCASSKFTPQVSVILGTQWGDEGKGKLVDVLAKQYDIVARAQGGANAGHTIYDDEGNKYKLHLIPSGILNPKTQCVIGHGVVVHLSGLFDEIKALEDQGVSFEGRFKVSDRAHLLFDLHKEVDGLREEELAGKQIGTTKRGIGPAYASKATRNGVRVSDLKDFDVFEQKYRALVEDAKKRFPEALAFFDSEAEITRHRELARQLTPMITDTIDYVNSAVERGSRVLVEGANATMLDLDFGTYPFVTSSNPSIGGVVTGLGLAPSRFEAVIGVAKAYSTRVGSGPYPTEIFGVLADEVREVGQEYGTTTGRPRRVGWLDMVALKYAARVNGLTHINLTKLDVLSDLDEIPIAVAYELPSGERITGTVPANAEVLDSVEVIYEALPGWKSDISGARSWADLPDAAKAYCQRIEELCGVPVKWIGVGPGRDALVEKST